MFLQLWLKCELFLCRLEQELQQLRSDFEAGGPAAQRMALLMHQHSAPSAPAGLASNNLETRSPSPFSDAPGGGPHPRIPDPTGGGPAPPAGAARRRSASPAVLGLAPHQQQQQQQQQQAVTAAPIPWLVAAARSLPTYKDADGGLGSVAEARRFAMPQGGGGGGIPTHAERSLSVPEHVDAEIAGLVYDLVHLAHEELIVVKVSAGENAGQ